MEVLWGLGAFVETAILVVVIAELNLIFENFLNSRLELRKGFSKKTISRFLHFLRTPQNYEQRAYYALTLLPVFLAVALLPGLREKIYFPIHHSLMFFVLVLTTAPLLSFFLQSNSKSQAGEVFVLRSHERALGATSLLFIVLIVFSLLTGKDDITEVLAAQKGRAWLIFTNPSTAILFLAVVFLAYYMSSQKVFSKTIIRGENTTQTAILHIWKTAWLIFAAVVFCGGGGPLLIVKVFFINLVASTALGAFGKLREDQSESLILWELTPIALFILLLAVVFVGGKV